MSKTRLVILLVSVGIIVATILTTFNSNNDIESIKPYIQEIALRDGMTQCSSRELKRDFGLTSEDLEGFLLYEGASEEDVRMILAAKLWNTKDSAALRRQLRIRLNHQLESIPDTDESRAGLLKRAQIITRGKFLLVTVSDVNDDIIRVFNETLRR